MLRKGDPLGFSATKWTTQLRGQGMRNEAKNAARQISRGLITNQGKRRVSQCVSKNTQQICERYKAFDQTDDYDVLIRVAESELQRVGGVWVEPDS